MGRDLHSRRSKSSTRSRLGFCQAFAARGRKLFLESLEDRRLLAPFTDMGALGLSGARRSEVAWGDYDNDGRLDLLLMGYDQDWQPLTKIYHNDGNNTFREISAGLSVVGDGSAAWGDYDNDGRLDILLTGGNSSENISKVYHNDGDGVFHDVGAGLLGVWYSSAAWGDYDNDGRLDILTTGYDENGQPVARVYHNNGNNTFHDIDAGLAGVGDSSAAWGDYDNDGRLDILVTGYDQGWQSVAQIYHNDGTDTFHDIGAGLAGVWDGAAAWGDYDNDDRLDILLTGTSDVGEGIAKVYHNDDNHTFRDIGADLSDVSHNSAAWGDYDNDGRIDILFSSGGVYRNRGYDFQDIGTSRGISEGSAVWGDYDNDGRLDFVVTGYEGGVGPDTRILRNSGSAVNIAPGAPTDLAVNILSSTAVLSWAASADDHTPANGLTYNLRVGTTPGGSDIKGPMADAANGRRRLAECGTVESTSWSLDYLASNTTYYWSVQAVDTALAGSAFAAERTFTTAAIHEPPSARIVNPVGVQMADVDIVYGLADANSDVCSILVEYSPDGGMTWTTATSAPGGDGTAEISSDARGRWHTFVWASAIDLPDTTAADVRIRITPTDVDGTGAPAVTAVFAIDNPNLPFVEQRSIELPLGDSGAVAWGDYDSDGRLDVLITGYDRASQPVARIYHNDGSNRFHDINAGLSGVSDGSAAWGDYDNDGRLDILLTGGNSSDECIAQVYHNDGNGVFRDIGAGLTGARYGSAAWGDYDNDGQLDILTTGYDQGWQPTTRVYRNDGSDTFRSMSTGLPGVCEGAAAWGDYDNDGRLDILLTGITAADEGIAQVYHNDGDGAFRDVGAGLTGVWYSSAAWGDYDNDGQLDILITGYDLNWQLIAQIYHNDGADTFHDIGAELTGVQNGSVAWGDYDNDGRLDVLLTGEGDQGAFAGVYRNDGSGGFYDIGTELTGAMYGSAAWGDYNNDGRLDIVSCGWDQNAGATTRFYRNVGPTANDVPAVPTGLSEDVVSLTAVLSWAAPADAQTPSSGLSFNVRVGTTPGGSDIVGPMAETSTGRRRLAEQGRVQSTSWVLNNLESATTYYWSVQAVDSALAGSPFSTERTFVTAAIHEPPSAWIVNPRGEQTADVTIAYGLLDANSDVCSILAEYSWNGGATWFPATAGPGGDGTVGLSSSARGKVHTFVWASALDLPGTRPNVIFRITPADVDGTGASVVTTPFTICNPDQTFVEQSSIYVASTSNSGSVAWGDYDNDGRLDVLLNGWDPLDGFPSTKIYANNGDDSFSNIGAAWTGAYRGSMAWGDHDNDGQLDVLLSGWNPRQNYTTAAIYHNDGGDSFHEISAGLTGATESAVNWGDYNNDGHLDILVSGRDPQGYPTTRIYRNDGADSFYDIGAGLIGLWYSAVAWGDYDNDGRLDILLAGQDFDGELCARIYHNDGHDSFHDVGAGLTGVTGSAAAWGDYDNDGRLDILLSGRDAQDCPTTTVYRNAGNGVFQDIGAGLVGMMWGSTAWGDYDNDGRLDILLTGYDEAGVGGRRIYRNSGNDSFYDIGADLTGISQSSSAAWGDYDNDGRLDILISGVDSQGIAITKIYCNVGSTTNALPAAPTGLSVDVFSSVAVLSWTAPTDSQTPTSGLSYNLRVGTIPGGSDIVGSMADASSGFRRLADRGMVQVESWTLRDLIPGTTYYWSVQAVDSTLAGSPFAVEGSFTTPYSSLFLADIEPTSMVFVEDGPATPITASITIDNGEGTELAGATIRITENYQHDEDVLGFTDTGLITGAWNADHGILTLSGLDTVANYQAALRSVTYRNTSEDPSLVVRVVSFQVSDGMVDSNVVTRNITKVDVISGKVWFDQDGDANMDADTGESGLAGWTVYLDANDNGSLDVGESFATTAADGAYRFIDVSPGSYVIRQIRRDLYVRTFPATDAYRVTLESGDSATDGHFLNTQITTISGTVYADLSGDGRRGPSVTPLGGEMMAHQSADGRQDAQSSLTTMASDAAGNFVIVWMYDATAGGRNDIVGRRFDSSGNPRGDEFTVNAVSSCNRVFPTVAMNAIGEFVILWTEVEANGVDADIFARRYDAAGHARGDQIRVDSGSYIGQGDPIAGIDDSGAFVVAWVGIPGNSSNYAVIARRFDSQGNPLGPEFEPKPGGNSNNNLVRASVAMNGDGRCLITWHSGYFWHGFNTFGVLYDATGAVVRDDLSFGPGGWVSADMDANGSFLATWTAPQGGDAGWEVFAQRFDASGNAVGPVIHVNTTTAGTQYTSRVASLPDGQFVVVWRDDSGNDGSGYGVFARCFDAAGQAHGVDFVASVTTDGWQAVPSVAAGLNGDFVVSWTGTGGGDPWCGVIFRRFHMTTLEPPLASWTVYVDGNNNGQLDAEETSTTTNAEGDYALVGAATLPTRIVRAVDPPDWSATGPADGYWDTRVTGCDFGFSFSLPTVSVTTPTGVQCGDVTIAYTLWDADSDTSDIAVEYSPDGGTTWFPATVGAGGDGTTGLTVSPSGQSHTFVWASASDLPGSHNPQVMVRIQPIDANGDGTADRTRVFLVTNPRLNAELRIVSTAFSADRMADASFASYASITAATGVYYAEIWVRDSLAPRGIAGGSVDLTYTTGIVDATAINHGNVFSSLVTGVINDAAGLVDNLGGATFGEHEGTTQWVRLGTTTFRPATAGDVTFTLGYDLAPGAGNASFAEVGAGNVDWSLVQFTTVPVTIHQSPTLVDVQLVPRIAKSTSDSSATLPTSDRTPFWVLEGDGTPDVNCFHVEVWVRSNQASVSAIGSGSVNVSFNPQYAHAVAIEHGSVFTTSPVVSIDNTTGVVSIGGGTARTDMGDDEYVLLGRIKFTGIAPVDEVAHQVGAYNMGVAVADGPIGFVKVGAGEMIATFQPVPAASVRAVIYDIDDSNAVDFGDFSYFVPAFGTSVGVSEPPYSWWADFDASGTVDFGDFGYFVTAFNKSFSDPSISFPSAGRGGKFAAGGSTPEISIELRIVATPGSSGHLSDDDFAAYQSITTAPLNSSYYAEVWLRDIRAIRGIAGGSVDLAYTTAIADATAIDHGSAFSVLTSGTVDDASGLVDNLGGGTFNTDEGTTQWVRLATTTFTALAAGDATFSIGHDFLPGAANWRFAEMGAGNLNWTHVQFSETPITVHTPPMIQPPTLDPINDREIPEDSPEVVVLLTGISPGIGDSEPIRIIALSSAPELVPAPTISYVAPDTQGSLRFTPIANANGAAVITVTVEDGGADLDLETRNDNATVVREFTIRVLAVQDPPSASADEYVVAENQTLTVFAPGVLSNDTDVDGEKLHAVLKTSTLHGTLQFSSDGGFAYTPHSGFNREDMFQYVANDGTDDSEVVVVVIKVDTGHPWYNGLNSRDVNDDGFVTPIDALLIINALNRAEGGTLPLDRPRPLTKPFHDVNRDGFLSPIDSLQVINYINKGGDGEGEYSDIVNSTDVPVMWWMYREGTEPHVEVADAAGARPYGGVKTGDCGQWPGTLQSLDLLFGELGHSRHTETWESAFGRQGVDAENLEGFLEEMLGDSLNERTLLSRTAERYVLAVKQH